MLNQSLAGLGNSFVQNRAQAQQRQRDIADELIRQGMADAQNKHFGAELEFRKKQAEREKDRNDTLAEGHVSTWLQDPDGGTFQFTGAPSGLQKIMDQAEQNDRPLTRMTEPPTAKPQYGEFTTEAPGVGTFRLHLAKPEDVDKAAEMAKKIGGMAPQRPGAQTKEMLNKKAYDAGMAQAELLEDSDPDAADKLRAETESRFGTGTKSETVTEEFPATTGTPASPGVPARSGILGIGARPGTPATPAVPGQPKRTVRRQVPVGTGAAARTGKTLDVPTATAYLKKAGGDKAKARALAIQDGYTP